MGALKAAAPLDCRQSGEKYGQFSVFHEIAVQSQQNWAVMSDWLENMLQVYIGVLGSPDPPGGAGLKRG